MNITGIEWFGRRGFRWSFYVTGPATQIGFRKWRLDRAGLTGLYVRYGFHGNGWVKLTWLGPKFLNKTYKEHDKINTPTDSD